MTRLWRQDLAWAGLILVTAAGVGLLQGQSLIPLSRELRHVQAQMDGNYAERRKMNGINLARAYDLFQQEKARFIDARPASEFAETHIPRALNLPPEELEKAGAEKIAGLAKNQEMVVYCNSEDCDFALTVAEKLKSWGFTRVMIFWDGMETWKKSGYPVEHSP